MDYNNQLLGCAMSWDNNYEYLDVPCPLNVVFRLELYPYSGTPNTYASVGFSLYTAENK